MKALVLSLFAAVLLITASTASATISKNAVTKIEAAIVERIDILKVQRDRTQASLPGASSQERFRLRTEVRSTRHRIQQLQSLKRLVPRLSKHQMGWLVHYLKLNVSVSSPTS